MVEYSKPIPHIIINNFFTKYQLDLILKEIKSLNGHLHIGDVKGKIIPEHKSNLNCWLDEAYINREDSDILNIFHYQFWSNTIKKMLGKAKNNIFHTYEFTTEDHTLLSVYRNGGYYKTHDDINTGILLTTVIMLCNTPQKFTGGDFILGGKLIKFENNKLIIFPCNTKHSVETVKCKDEFDNYRYSLQYFARIN